MSTIPSEVDVLILGTGLTNSILAAACSRVGKSVLHLDENSYYGGDWASFTFRQLVDWIELKHKGNPRPLPDEEYPPELIENSRMFCLDLSPRFLYSNGPMVELLVESNVARYHEFKNNIRTLCLIGNDEIHVLPCRRNEVFTSPLLPGLAAKRRLMKFVELCIKFEPEAASTQDKSETESCSSEIEQNATKPIKQFLDERNLEPTLQEYLINSIAMVQPDEQTQVACRNIKRFMLATERFGRSPFLFPLYGCGEFPQSFCRLSAVFGGIYCLNTKIEDLEIGTSETPSFSIKFSGSDQEVKSSKVVVDYDCAQNLSDVIKANCGQVEKLSRAILITRKSIISPPADGDDKTVQKDLVSFLRIPSSITKSHHVAYLLEFNSSALVCPKDFYIVYLWTKASTGCSSAEEDLNALVSRVYKDDSSAIIWKFYFFQSAAKSVQMPIQSDTVPPLSLHITSPSCDDVDYASNIQDARCIFERMYPEEEFLPRAPDPDEIVSS